MKIQIRVKTNSRVSKIEKLPDQTFKVSVCSQREKGRANEEVVDLLSQYFDVAKNRVRIISGLGSAFKTVEILQ